MEIGKISDKIVDNSIKSVNINKDGEDFKKKLEAAIDSKDEKELMSVCREFESIMLGMVYKGMKATVPKVQIIPQETGREMFESMLDEEVVKQASQKRSYGLAESLYKQLSKNLGWQIDGYHRKFNI